MSSRIKSNGFSAAVLAMGIAGITAMLVAPADAHKHQPKPSQQPPIQVMKFTPKPVVRDHRPQPVVRDHRGGVVVRDQRTSGASGGVTVTKSTARVRTGSQCLGSLCGVVKAANKTVGGVIKAAKTGKYPGRPPIPR